MRTPRSCLILGSGMGGLALGALLARAGVEVTILEAHPEYIGGWAHTLHLGGYKFAAGPRYLWNFGPGQIGRRFLDKCALAEQVPMVELDRRGFDHIYVGDDEPIRVPNGWSEYEALLQERFPEDARGIHAFFGLCRRVFQVFEVIDEQGLYLEPWGRMLPRCFGRRPLATAWVLLHRRFTVQQAFEHCGLSDRVRRVLSAHAAIFASPVESLSFHAYAAGTLFYHRGCYYPANDMEGFVGAIAKTIEHGKGLILCDQRVVSVQADARGIRQVRTHTGDRFTADAVVVNFDPKSFLSLIDHPGRTPNRGLPRYRYSASISSLFLGVTDVRILEQHFGRWNIWYQSATGARSPFQDPDPLQEPVMLYLNSPTLVKGVNTDAPPGHATVTAFAPCRYPALQPGMAGGDEVMKERHTALLVDAIARRFIPGLKEHLAVVHLRTPDDKERLLCAPGGNIYGRSFEPQEVWTKLPFKGLMPNLYFVGSYVSFASIASVIHGACRVYEELTRDHV
jgi:phytoene dehydrogenase-like protein